MANQWGGQSDTPDMLKAPMMPDAFDASADTPTGRRVASDGRRAILREGASPLRAMLPNL